MSLPPTDRRILFELFQDARQSIDTIAKTLKLPKMTVANRINGMLREKVIKKFTTIVNYQKLGYNRHSLYVDLKYVNYAKIKENVQKILKLPGISCCYYLQDISEWKLYLSVWTKTIGEYDTIQSSILEGLGDDVLNYVSFQSVRSYTYLSRSLNPLKTAKCDVKEGSENIAISKDEWQLINLLHENSRRPLVELAQELHTHTDTIRRKMKKLQTLGILSRYYPLIDFNKVGIKEYTFIVRLNASAEAQIEDFIRWARKNPQFVIIIKAVGWVNLYYAFQTENDDQFRAIRTDIEQRIGDITLKEFRIEVKDIIR